MALMAAKRSSTKRARARPKPSRARGKTKAGARTRAPSNPLAHAADLANRGDVIGALRAAEAVFAADPRHWQAGHLMSQILWNIDRRDEAVTVLQSTIESAPPTAEIQIGLVGSLMELVSTAHFGLEKTIAIGERTVERYGPTFALLRGLCMLHLVRSAPLRALTIAERLVDLYPDSPHAHFILSTSLIALGRGEDAVVAYGRGLRPYDATTGKSAEEIRRQYESLAPAYDENMLHQSFSERMAKFVFGLVGSTLAKRVLDAGCGTGLLGTHLRAARLVGIDQSPDMLTKARARGIYAELVEGDLVQAMAARTDSFDLVASACVLYHIADLAPFFREAARLLVPGGHLFFSVDPAPDAMDIGVSSPGEYTHSRRYLRRLAAETGFTEAAIKIMLHRAYPGFWCAFRRKAAG